MLTTRKMEEKFYKMWLYKLQYTFVQIKDEKMTAENLFNFICKHDKINHLKEIFKVSDTQPNFIAYPYHPLSLSKTTCSIALFEYFEKLIAKKSFK